MSGRSSKRKGKAGESNAKKFVKQHRCHVAMTEIQGLAGDDMFIKDTDGKWWSVEIKNVVTLLPKYISQAKRQAEERFQAVQEELSGDSADVYYTLGLDRYRKTDWALMWHPSNYGCGADDYVVFYGHNGRTKVATIDNETGWRLP